jgi:hypothetical protein
VDFFGGGRLLPIAQARPLLCERTYDVRNAAALYDAQSLVLVESLHLDSRLITGTARTNGETRGLIGGVIALRVRARKPGLPSIPIADPPVFTVAVHPRTSGQEGWQTAAALWRTGLKPSAAHALYRGCYLYKQLATWGPIPEARHRQDEQGSTQNLFRTLPFSDIAENARGFFHLTDGIRQVLYIGGWQKGGFDSAYPEPYEAEERCGGDEGLRQSLMEIRTYNALSGLHDNFDDIAHAHADCPYAAVDEHGEPWRGWSWAAGMTRILGIAKYVRAGAAHARIGRMMERFPLAQTHHLDVLTAEPWRVDFDTDHPASAQESFRAKMAVVDAFAARGLDVTSELLVHPAVGKIGFALHTRLEPDEILFPGEAFIPLTAMVYHGIIGYTAPSHTPRQMLLGLLIGAQTFHEEDITGPLCISRFYIQGIPAMLLYDQPLTRVTRQEDVWTASYGDTSSVTVDFARATYRVVVGGVMVGQDFTTLAPGPKGLLAYAFNGALRGYPIPGTLRGAKTVRVTPLTPQGDRTPWTATLQGGTLDLDIPPMTPVRID